MCIIGKREYPELTRKLVNLACMVGEHQAACGFLHSNEQPRGSVLMQVDEWIAVYGDVNADGILKPPWKLFVLDGCQVGYAYPGEDDPGRPMKKTAHWVSNFDLSPLAIRHHTGPVGALVGCTHTHRIVRGGAKLPEGRWVSVAAYSGKYPSVLCTIYARCLARGLAESCLTRKGSSLIARCETRLEKLAKTSREVKVVEHHRVSVPIFLIGRGGLTYEISEVAQPALASSPEQKPLARQFEVEGQETTADRDRRLESLSKASKLAEKHWKMMAQHQKWDEVRADIVVYKYSGEDVKVDPRRVDAYRQQVVDGLGFGDN